MKQIVQSLLRRFGYEIRRASPGGEGPAATAAWFLRNNPSPVVFDVGAHVGEITMACRALIPKARIYSFEPFPASRERLRQVVGVDPLTSIEPFALADKKGSANFHGNKLDATNSLLPSSTTGAGWWGKVYETETTLSVETTTIADFAREHGVSHIDLLKLDIQGGEYKALLGARDMLSSGKISLVWLEILAAPAYEGQAEVHELFHLLGSHGLVLWDLYQLDRRAGRLYQMDAVFVKKELLPASPKE